MIIPSVSIFKGNVVKVLNNKYNPINIKFSDLIAFKTIYITDINGIEMGNPQLDFIKKNSLKKELWVDSGIRYSENVVDILISGAEYVIIGTKTLVSLKELEKTYEFTENIIFQIDYENGIISSDLEIINMGGKNLAEKCKSIGISKIILADYSAIEKNSVNYKLVNELLSVGVGVYVITNKKFSYELEKIGVKGTIVKFDELMSA